MTSYAEDLPVGVVVPLGSYVVTTDEIVAFARQWDPQAFHVDAEVAAAGYFGELIASGLHTLGVFQRLCVLGALNDWSVVAGRRIREVQFPAPVPGGTTLRGEIEVESVTPTHPDRSLVVMHGRLRRDDGTLVMTSVFETYVRPRTGRPASPR